MQIWIPVVVAIVGMVGGGFLYQIQKTVDRRNQIKQERRLLYRQFVIAHNELKHQLILTDDRDGQFSALLKLEQTIAEIFVTAPDAVVAECDTLIEMFTRVGMKKYPVDEEFDKNGFLEATTEVHVNYLTIVQAMREDTYEETGITRKTLEVLLQDVMISVGKMPF